MNSERLLHLASILDNVPHEAFDIGMWECPIGDRAKAAPCGFVACAVGHACLDPKFKAEGLSLMSDEIRGINRPCYQRPEERPLYGWFAVNAFFELPNDNAHFLFDRDWYSQPCRSDIIPSVVAARIREFVANGGRP